MVEDKVIGYQEPLLHKHSWECIYVTAGLYF